MTDSVSAARILTELLAPSTLTSSALDRVLRNQAKHALLATSGSGLSPFEEGYRFTESDALALVERDRVSTQKVLGFLASHGPSRSITVIDDLVDEDNPEAPLSLTDVASAIDGLLAKGLLERRDGEVISVVGDTR